MDNYTLGTSQGLHPRASGCSVRLRAPAVSQGRRDKIVTLVAMSIRKFLEVIFVAKVWLRLNINGELVLLVTSGLLLQRSANVSVVYSTAGIGFRIFANFNFAVTHFLLRKMPKKCTCWIYSLSWLGGTLRDLEQGMPAVQGVVEYDASQNHGTGAEVHAAEARLGDEHPEDERAEPEADVAHHEERRRCEAHAVAFGGFHCHGLAGREQRAEAQGDEGGGE